MLSTLHLSIREGCDEPYIDFHVDGQSLHALIFAAHPSAETSGGECLSWYCNQDETVLGDTARTKGLDSALLFDCAYGSCGWVTTDVEVGDITITFSNFCVDGQDTVDLAPIVFDRRQFESEVADLTARIAKWKPPPPPPPRRVLITPPPP